jgi:hypothetical protein
VAHFGCGDSNAKRGIDSIMAPKGSTQKESNKGSNHGTQAPKKMKTLFSFFGKKDPPAVAAPSSSPPDDSSAPKSLPPPQPHLGNSHVLSQVKVGSTVIEVYWSQDEEWYSAKILKQRGSSTRFYIEYTQDGQCEWIDLNTEQFRLAQETTKKRGRNIQLDDDDDEEFEMPDSEEEREIDNDDDDDQWMVTDDEDDLASKKTKGFKKLKPSGAASSQMRSSKTPPSRSTTTTPKASAKAALSLQVFAAGGPVAVTQVGTKTPRGGNSSSSADRTGRQPVTPGTSLSKTSPFESSPLLLGSATATSRTPGAQASKTATSRTATPPAFVVGALNPVGSHVHNHLAFLQHPVDAQGRSPDHVDYDARTLRVNDKDWVKLMGKPMTDAVKQWWDLKKMYFDTVLLFKTGEWLRAAILLAH